CARWKWGYYFDYW
nr:immunoglobulin heavy chain junction region [Mus musculus]MBK4195916.1 immunoglobulin heavy chain junction region [Mus musculus]MBK4195917.1 immunoglobulin heavy chain junction region [Mus musculus]MBK4195918.1 immunoglobulin heavy chain junction region [Mus musculus]MBK4195919.1 immunoglobulin heavy chain junction region [Mus musculus]